jgi:hypothetical protein
MLIMSSYLISGPSGSGKSTVGKVLQQRGYRIIETDSEEGLSDWVDINNGQIVTEIPRQPFPQEWLDGHRWTWDVNRMTELLSTVGVEPVFFCGGASNEKDFFGDFDKRFGLCAENELLIERLQIREPERWVDDSAELKRGLEWNDKFKNYCISVGAIVIDSSDSPDATADAILRHMLK